MLRKTLGNSPGIFFIFCCLTYLCWINGPLCYSAEDANVAAGFVVGKSTGVPRVFKETHVIESTAVEPFTNTDIGYDIEVNGNAVTDVTDRLIVEIGYQYLKTIPTGGDRFVVAKTPMKAPGSDEPLWFSYTLPERNWRLGIWGNSFPAFNRMDDWRTERVLEIDVTTFPGGEYIFCIAYDRNPNGEIDTDSLLHACALANVKSPITATLGADTLSGTAPLNVTFDVGVSDPKFIMDTCSLIINGVAQHGCGPFVKHTFDSEGLYVTWVEVTDDYGRKVYSNNLKIIVDPPVAPTVQVSASPTSGQAPLDVNINVSITGSSASLAEFCTLHIGTESVDCLGTRQFSRQLTMGTEYTVYAIVDGPWENAPTQSNWVSIDVEGSNQPPTVSNLSVSPRTVKENESFSISYDYADLDGLDDVDWHVISIGTWSKDYLAGGSGHFLESYQFNEGTTLGDHAISVYVIDSAGNNSNTLTSSIHFDGGAQQCGTFTEAGGDAGETHYVEMGQTSGWFWFDYNTYDQEDRIKIYYGDTLETVFDSGCVGTKASAHKKFGPGNSTKIRVEVYPNCFGGSGTKWDFTVHCPDQAPYGGE